MRRAGWWMLLSIIGLYMTALCHFGRFLTYDEIEYKAPGREWAAVGRFAAPELIGFWRIFGIEGVQDPSEVWLINSPLYPMLFGAYVKLVGFGWRQSVLFDALISSGLAIACYAVARRIAPEQSSWCSFLVGGLALMFGIAGRPEDLTLLLGMIGLLSLLLDDGWTGAAMGGMALGFSVGASFVGASLLAPTTLLILMRTSGTPGRALRKGLVLGSCAVGPILLVYVPFLRKEPRSFDQLRALSRWNLEQSQSQKIFEVARELLIWNYGYVLLICVGLILAMSFPVDSPKSGETHGEDCRNPLGRVPLWAGSMLSLLVVFLKFPNKWYYYWFLIPWLSIIAVVGVARWFPRGRLASRLAVGGFAAGALALASVPILKNTLVLTSLGASQRIGVNDQRARELIPAGSRVVDHHLWSSLAGERTVYDSIFSRPDFAEVDYIIQHGNGSGAAGVPVPVPGMPSHGFEVIHDNLNRESLRLFGLRFTNSGWGFGHRILKRVDAPAQ